MFYLFWLQVIVYLLMIFYLFMTNMSLMYHKRSSSSPFECGFDPLNSSRLAYSMRFFLLAMVFLIFDIEIVLLLPFIFLSNFMLMKSLYLLSAIFLSVLLIGLVHEWNQGTLSWVK